MKHMRIPTRRGLTLLELLIALTITAMVAAAIYGMLGAVSTGLLSNRDSRDVMVWASAAQMRVSGYVAASSAVLAADTTSVTLWLDDARESGTVQGSEIRWLIFDERTDELYVCFVTLPDAWSDPARDLEDMEFAADSDWDAVLEMFAAKDLISTMPLIDELESVTVVLDAAPPTARYVGMDLEFQTVSGTSTVRIASVIRMHEAPQ